MASSSTERTIKRQRCTIEKIPEELLFDVFKRLPIKSLIRFRSSCSYILHLLDSKDFCTDHWRFHRKKNSMIVLGDSILLSTISLFSLKPRLLSPPLPQNPNPIILNSCNGIVLVLYEDQAFGDKLVLWNPMTRRHLKLPQTEPCGKILGRDIVTYGLAHDIKNDDYLVFRIFQGYSDLLPNDLWPHVSKLHIFSSNSNSWKDVKGYPYSIKKSEDSERTHGVFVCNKLHWVVRLSLSVDIEEITSFDLKGNFKMVGTPKQLDTMTVKINIADLAGGLCMIHNSSDLKSIEVWQLLVYDQVETWSMLLNVSFDEVPRLNYVLKPICYSENEDEVLFSRSDNCFLWYNLMRRDYRIVDGIDVPEVFTPVLCNESLTFLGPHADKDELNFTASYSKFCDVAIQLARKAAEIIEKRIDEAQQLEQEKKADLVIKMGKECDDLIFKHLKLKFPDHKLLGKNTTTELTNKPTWTFDSLNGTTKFVNGNPFFCVSIGLIIGKVPIVGVVYNPVTRQVFTGIHGGGSFLNGNAIKVSLQSDLQKSCLATEAGNNIGKLTLDTFTNKMKVGSHRISESSALELCRIACGNLDLFYSFGFGGPWSVAAGAVIVKEAGGALFGPFGKEFDVLGHGIAASNALLKDALKEALK